MRKGVWILIGLAAIALLGAAAFFIVRLLNSAAPQGQSLSSQLAVTPGGKLAGGMQYDMTPAPELPTARPDFMANVSQIKDNSVYVTSDAKLTQGAGTVYELVIAADTKIYRDTTGENPPPPANVTWVQQTVVQADRSQFAPGDLVAIWGDQRSTRWIASVVLIYGPAVAK